MVYEVHTTDDRLVFKTAEDVRVVELNIKGRITIIAFDSAHGFTVKNFKTAV